MRAWIGFAGGLLSGCAASTDLPGRVSGLVYDEDVTCEGTDCGALAEPFDASAVVGEDASRFAPEGVYIYGWFWREDGRFVEVEIDAPDPTLAIDEPVIEYREWQGNELVFESEEAEGEVAVDGRGADAEIAGHFSLLLSQGDVFREIHEGRFTTVPPPPGLSSSHGTGGTGGNTGTEPVHEEGTVTYDEGPAADVYIDGGCTCYSAEPEPSPDGTYDSGGGCDSSCDGDSSEADYSGGGGGCDGCEGDTAPSDVGGGGCSGETGAGGCGGCEGDVAAASAAPRHGHSVLARIGSQNFPFAALAAGLVYWKRRARQQALRSK
jgi:hypothetical protein